MRPVANCDAHAFEFLDAAPRITLTPMTPYSSGLRPAGKSPEIDQHWSWRFDREAEDRGSDRLIEKLCQDRKGRTTEVRKPAANP